MNKIEYIPLASAHVTQHIKGAIKTEWKIEENITDKRLGELPKRLNEKEVFSILDFSRKYELEAFNSGIIFGKKEYKKTFDSKLREYEYNLQLARTENERLAEALEIITNKNNR